MTEEDMFEEILKKEGFSIVKLGTWRYNEEIDS